MCRDVEVGAPSSNDASSKAAPSSGFSVLAAPVVGGILIVASVVGVVVMRARRQRRVVDECEVPIVTAIADSSDLDQ